MSSEFEPSIQDGPSGSSGHPYETSGRYNRAMRLGDIVAEIVAEIGESIGIDQPREAIPPLPAWHRRPDRRVTEFRIPPKRTFGPQKARRP